jgi:hypothetical protein
MRISAGVCAVLVLAACRGGSQPVAKQTASDAGRPAPVAPVANDAPPRDPDMLAEITPDAIVGRGLQSTTTWVHYTPDCVKYRGCDPTVYYRPADQAPNEDGDYDRAMVFGSRPIARDRATDQLVMWQFADEPEPVHGALLSGTEGNWQVRWISRPLYTDISDVEASLGEDTLELPLLQIAPARWALLYSPAVSEGDGDGEAEDYFVSTRLIEIAADGPKDVWSYRGPQCWNRPADEYDQSCGVEVLATTTAGVFDLQVTARVYGRKNKVTTYQFDGTTYQPAKK